MTVEGKVTIVTGAFGGLGLAITKAFLAAGAKVVMVGRNEQRLKDAVAGLGVPEDQYLPLIEDVTIEENVKAIYAATIEKFGRVDVLVNNAGIVDKFDPVGSLDLALYERIIATNLTAPIMMSKYAVNHFLSQEPKSGVIVNIGSIGSTHGGRAGVAYTTSKHGLIGFTKNTAAFYTSKGIRCNAVLPGGMNTNVSDGYKDNANVEAMMQCAKTMEVSTFDNIMVDPAQVAQTVLYLASENAVPVSGACIAVDNAWGTW